MCITRVVALLGNLVAQLISKGICFALYLSFFCVGKDQESLMPCLLTRSVVQESNLHSSHLALEWNMEKCRPFKAVRCISSWFSIFVFCQVLKYENLVRCDSNPSPTCGKRGQNTRTREISASVSLHVIVANELIKLKRSPGDTTFTTVESCHVVSFCG